jgi:hypothetical protein
MAVYNCECGLIISTSSDRPQCLRCLRVLGPQDFVDRTNVSLIAATVSAVAAVERRSQLRKVTMGFRLNERPVLSPIVRPK